MSCAHSILRSSTAAPSAPIRPTASSWLFRIDASRAGRAANEITNMLHQRTRDVYFTALRRVNKLNYWHWKIRGLRANGSGALHLHLGCGPKYIAGFVNVDGNILRKRDVWLDLRNGLPFSSGSVASIYS